MKLVQLASLWTLVNHPSRGREWSIDKKFQAIKAAGFAGVSTRLDAAIGSLAQKYRLIPHGIIFADDPADYINLLSAQKNFGARHVDVQLGHRATSLNDAVKQWIHLEKEARTLEMSVSLETHRGTVTGTAEKLFALADRYEKITSEPLRLTWDFSHFAVVNHLHSANFSEQLLSRPDLVQHASHFHFRPFNGHHAQLPVTFKGALSPEAKDYLEFAQEVMQLWKSTPLNHDRSLYASPDLGPHGGYALSGFPPVWGDAIVLSGELTKCWKRAR